jgi:hypothetical protein
MPARKLIGWAADLAREVRAAVSTALTPFPTAAYRRTIAKR